MKSIFWFWQSVVLLPRAWRSVRSCTANGGLVRPATTDVGFWWTVIAVLLAIAATGALVGTWIHTQPGQR